jgi:plastocyanin
VLFAVTGGMAGVGPVLLATAPPAWAFQAEAQMIETDPRVYSFNPPVIEIYVGDRVRWRNDTPVKHTVTSDPGSPVAFDSDEVPPPPPDSSQPAKNEYTKRFTERGEYNYRCKIHSNMRGVVQVTDPRVTSTTATTAPPPPPPSTATTARPTTTTTAPATTTTAPTTTTTLRPPAGVEPPPVPATAAAPPPTRPPSPTTTMPSSTTTTTTPPPTTAPPAPPSTSPEVASPVPPTSTPPATDPPATGDTGDQESTAAAPISRDGETDPATVALVAALVAVGLFGAWTLIRVRPGRV